MFTVIGTSLLVLGLLVGLDLLTVDLGSVGSGAVAAMLLIGGLVILGLTTRSLPASDRRVMHVQTSRDDRVRR